MLKELKLIKNYGGIMTEEKESSIEENAAAVLFNYSIGRDDIKELTDGIPEESGPGVDTLLYELQILKIISTGVSINFLIENEDIKNRISKVYWEHIFEFSKSVTEATKNYSNVNVDYFEIIKKKLDLYLKELNENKGASEPAAVIGPCFAYQCGNREDTFTVMAGVKLFKSALIGIKNYFYKEGLIASI